MTFTDWHVGEPNNLDNHENCIYLDRRRNTNQWFDQWCIITYYFVCEEGPSKCY